MQESEIGLAEAAQRLTIPYQDCHRLVLTGVIRGEKRGNRWMVPLADVERLARERIPSGRGEDFMGKPTKAELENENSELREALEEISDRVADILAEEEEENDEDGGDGNHE